MSRTSLALFAVFVVTPITELYLLITVGRQIGVLPTLGIVLFTAMTGAILLRRQGLATLTRGMGRLDRGELPAEEFAEGLLLAVAGALLLTPGFVTDVIGFTLLVPVSRRAIAKQIVGKVAVHQPGGPAQPPPPGVIEGEFERRE